MRELALAIVLSALSLPAAAETMRIGSAILEFDPARFALEARTEGGATLACIAPGCRESGGRRPAIHIGTSPAAGPEQASCRPPGTESGRRGDREIVVVGPLTFEIRVEESACRALSPDLKTACAVVGSQQLRMSTGSLGCSNAPIFPYDMMLELVGGVKPAS